MLGLVGRKKGMTRVFTKEGVSIPVTLIEVEPNRITQIKTVAGEQYDAVQVTTGSQKRHRVNKPTIGHYAKAKVELGRGLWEFRISSEELQWISDQKNLSLDLLKTAQKVDVTGTSKGKGFSGVMKRWNFGGQGASHGNSLSHRAPGSIGQNQTPGRVFPGKKNGGTFGQ